MGTDVRAVCAYTGSDTFELPYVKDEVREAYTDDEIRQLVADTVMESLATPVYESGYNLGQVTCTVRYFDRGTMVHFPLSDGIGVVVTFEPDGVSPTRAFLADCRERIEFED